MTGVSVTPQTSNAEAGSPGSRQLSATVSPEDATNKTVTFSIAPSTEGLTVSGSGLIEWNSDVPAGQYTTTVTSEDGGHTATHALTLMEPDPEEGEG